MERGIETADEAAARWAARLNARSVTTAELDQFHAWRREPANAKAYARTERVWREARDLSHDPDIQAIADEALSKPPSFLRLGLPRWPTLAMACVVLFTAIGVGLWWQDARGTLYRTEPGQRLALTLDDGSRVQLNSDTRIRVRFGSDRRNIELERGEAFFTVRADTSRPFVVHSGSMTALAVGTSFSTRRSDNAFLVVVATGVVDVDSSGGSPLRLDHPGAAALARAGENPASLTVDLDQSIAWTTGKLVFRRTALSAAINEVNRYSPRTITLADPRLGDLEVDGTFDVGDVESFVVAVAAMLDLETRTEGTTVRLEPPPSDKNEKNKTGS